MDNLKRYLLSSFGYKSNNNNTSNTPINIEKGKKNEMITNNNNKSIKWNINSVATSSSKEPFMILSRINSR